MPALLDRIISLIAPFPCLGCDTEGALLCGECLDLLPQFIPQCYRCGKTTNGFITCSRCARQSQLDWVYARTMYEGVGRTLVERLKFERTFSAAHVIAQSITNQFPFQLHNSAVLVPVPTATSRVRHRGFDQSLLITKTLAKQNKTQYKRLLLRLGQQRQTGSERKQRLVQLEGAFEVRVRALRGVRQVILVDDVLTTGSTLEVAARMLKEAGVKRVSAIVFARAINDK